ncbi:MAG: hypothetical protein KKF79_14605 [Gammaproteobacteria bacterium]|nr:hypothetical protein [Gammaproteobacteria bacterium]
MKNLIGYLVSVTALVLFYVLLLALALSVTMVVEQPTWWPVSIFGAYDGLLAWMQLSHGSGVLLAALAVAWLIQRFFRDNWQSLSLMVSLLCALLMFLPWLTRDFSTPDFLWSHVLDLAKIFLLPPLCCWVMIKYQPLAVRAAS